MALDLEGVLINHELRGNLAKRYPEAGGGRLRRPLANELLAWLSGQSNQIVIWTAAAGKTPILTPNDAFIRSSGLCIPDSVTILSRYQYIWAIAASNNTAWANSME